MFQAVSCKAVSCVINPVELLGPVGPMRSPFGWTSFGSYQESQIMSTGLPVEFPENPLGSPGVSILVQEPANLGPWYCHLGFMGLPFGVHGTAVRGPCDRCLGSVGLPF